jgi:hypothetical protein
LQTILETLKSSRNRHRFSDTCFLEEEERAEEACIFLSMLLAVALASYYFRRVYRLSREARRRSRDLNKPYLDVLDARTCRRGVVGGSSGDRFCRIRRRYRRQSYWAGKHIALSAGYRVSPLRKRLRTGSLHRCYVTPFPIDYSN